MSLRIGRSITLKDGVTSMKATTTHVTKIPAPKSVPTTSSGLACRIPAKEEKMSGAPFPKAKNVTP